MVMLLLHSGCAALEYEIAQERASALGRLGRRLEGALAALAACPRTDNCDPKTRDSFLVEGHQRLLVPLSVFSFVMIPLACLLFSVRAFAQFEVAPDHFDSSPSQPVHRSAVKSKPTTVLSKTLPGAIRNGAMARCS